jgi:hypothetical protein
LALTPKIIIAAASSQNENCTNGVTFDVDRRPGINYDSLAFIEQETLAFIGSSRRGTALWL